MKYAQDEYWGSPEWERSWNRRAHVEGVFDRIKNPSTEKETSTTGSSGSPYSPW